MDLYLSSSLDEHFNSYQAMLLTYESIDGSRLLVEEICPARIFWLSSGLGAQRVHEKYLVYGRVDVLSCPPHPATYSK